MEIILSERQEREIGVGMFRDTDTKQPLTLPQMKEPENTAMASQRNRNE